MSNDRPRERALAPFKPNAFVHVLPAGGDLLSGYLLAADALGLTIRGTSYGVEGTAAVFLPWTSVRSIATALES